MKRWWCEEGGHLVGFVMHSLEMCRYQAIDSCKTGISPLKGASWMRLGYGWAWVRSRFALARPRSRPYFLLDPNPNADI